ncbi:MAG: hypothetical protein GXP43_02690 [bacterium]|nr:hypothetical protein [bacterium]
MLLPHPLPNTKTYLDKAVQIINQPIASIKPASNIGIIISGGIDSSVLYALSRQLLPNLTPFTLISSKSQDLPYLKLLEKHFHQPITYINIDSYPADFLLNKTADYQTLLSKINLKATADQLAIAVGFDLLFEQIKKTGINTLLTAQGPDILVGGYARYNNLQNTALKTKIKADLPAIQIDIDRDLLVAKQHQLSLVNPYLTNDFINFCLGLPVNLIHYNNHNKYLIRLLAQQLHLPPQIITRPKKAFQYSTRLLKILTKLKTNKC